MNLISVNKLALIFFVINMLSSSDVQSQNSQIDSIVKNTYNLDFEDISSRLESLKKSQCQISEYLEVDYLWWQMISNLNVDNEKKFLSSLDNIKVNSEIDENRNYSKLFYFIYQIRYDNLKQREILRYFSIVKLHFYLERVKSTVEKFPNSFLISIVDLIIESDKCMKYELLIKNGFKSANNIDSLNICRTRIENMQNSEYRSFDIVKQYYLGKIYFDIEKDYKKALNKFIALSIECPNNKIFKALIEECNRKCAELSKDALL